MFLSDPPALAGAATAEVRAAVSYGRPPAGTPRFSSPPDGW